MAITQLQVIPYTGGSAGTMYNDFAFNSSTTGGQSNAPFPVQSTINPVASGNSYVAPTVITESTMAGGVVAGSLIATSRYDTNLSNTESGTPSATQWYSASLPGNLGLAMVAVPTFSSFSVTSGGGGGGGNDYLISGYDSVNGECPASYIPQATSSDAGGTLASPTVIQWAAYTPTAGAGGVRITMGGANTYALFPTWAVTNSLCVATNAVPAVPTSSSNTGGGSLVAGNTYQYAICAILANGQTGPSTKLGCLSGAGGGRKITVNWSAYTGATGYILYRYDLTTATSVNSFVVLGNVLTYQDTGSSMTASTNYMIAVSPTKAHTYSAPMGALFSNALPGPGTPLAFTQQYMVDNTYTGGGGKIDPSTSDQATWNCGSAADAGTAVPYQTIIPFFGIGNGAQVIFVTFKHVGFIAGGNGRMAVYFAANQGSGSAVASTSSGSGAATAVIQITKGPTGAPVVNHSPVRPA